MSFTGTQDKCKVCVKTVYVMDLLSADGIPYHKACFKCNHCKSTLQLSNYSSMEGVLYCKTHFEQLFKESGNFSKNFQSPAKSAEKLTPEQTRSPSKASLMFSGTVDKCATCGKTAYPLEKVTVESQSYHKTCFKCSHGGCALSPSNYAALEVAQCTVRNPNGSTYIMLCGIHSRSAGRGAPLMAIAGFWTEDSPRRSRTRLEPGTGDVIV